MQGNLSEETEDQIEQTITPSPDYIDLCRTAVHQDS